MRTRFGDRQKQDLPDLEDNQDRTYALEPVIASALNLSLRAQRGNLVA